MISYALTQAPYGKKKNGKTSGYGIKRLLGQNVFVAAYPTHDGSWDASKNDELDGSPMRELLHSEWARDAV